MEKGASSIRSPKRRNKARKEGPVWEAAYASFSEEFAYSALEFLQPPIGSVIVDPFVGSGTSYLAANHQNCNFIGIDINPYSALLTKAKSAVEADRQLVRRLLGKVSQGRVSQPATADPNKLFRTKDVRYLNTLFGALTRRLGRESGDPLRVLLEDKSGAFDSETIALASALRASKSAARTHRRSNPAWIMVGPDPLGQSPTVGIQDQALSYGELMLNELAQSRERNPRTWCQVYAADFSAAPIPDASIAYFLTSPPYMSRLDYVVSYLPQLTALSLFSRVDLELLRMQMMGTTKMRGPLAENVAHANPLVADTLRRIRNHPSQASSGYYFRFYLQYFTDLARFLDWLRLKSRPDAQGFLVLQDSFYKELRLPMFEIVRDLARSRGFAVESKFVQPKRNHVGAMSPDQQRYAPDKTLREHVILITLE